MAFGYDRRDLGHDVSGRPHKHGVTPGFHHPRAKNDGLEFVSRKHQRGKIKTLIQDIADAGLTDYRHACKFKGDHIPVNRPN